MTQHESILKQLKRRWMTPLDALRLCGTMKLASRVSELRRDGVVILDRWVEVNGKRFKAYRITRG